MLVTQQAAVHLGNDCLENLHSAKNQPQRTVKQLFTVTKKLVSEQKEVHGISLVDWQEDSWKRKTCWPSISTVNSENLRILRLSIARGKNS